MSKLNVLYQFNEKYVPYAGVSITSLLENNKKAKEISIYILGEDILDVSKEIFRKLAEQYERQIYFVDTKELVYEMKKAGINDYRGSYATNMKMFAPLYITNTVERLLYIDSDTIITDALETLFSCEMNGKPIAMVLDSLCAKHKLQVGHKTDDLYFNGGVILFDIQKWKELKCTERIVDHAKNVRAHYMAPDQDLINVVLKNEICKLDIGYNLQPIHIAYPPELYFRFFGQPNYYNEKEIKYALENPKIMHTFRFLGEFPWHKGAQHPQAEWFDYYLKKSLWKDYVKIPSEKDNAIFKIERWMYKKLPRSIFIVIFKLYYEYFLWKSDKDSLKHKNNKNM